MGKLFSKRKGNETDRSGSSATGPQSQLEIVGSIPRIFLVLSLCCIFSMGLVMIFSTTSAEILDHDLDRSTHQALFRQMLYAVAGLFFAVIIERVGYRNFIDSSPLLLILFTCFLVLTLVPGIGREVNGSKRWLNLGGFSIQPSEFVKYILPAYFIHQLMRCKELSWKWFFRLCAKLSIPILLILIEPNNGTTVVIVFTLVILCFLAKLPYKYWGVPLLAFIFIGSVFAYNLPYVAARLKVYMNPELDIQGKGHQPYQAKIAAGSGRLFGKGPGNSLQKLSYLPEAQNDYIAAIFAEEFGFIGVGTLIFFYMLVTYTGFYIAFRCEDIPGYLLAASITFLFGFQAFLNMGVVSGLLPSTGLNLPLFSQGGSSLIANIIGIGLLLSTHRRSIYA